ncbi:MAG: squalene/phytoene synthase family protein, partial [Bdellovibrionota bacterium]
MQKFDYQTHLNRVSRSFALAITFLENPLQEWVSMSYLLCRILDTIEDAPWPQDFSVDALSAYQQFKNFLETRPSAEEIREWRESFPSAIP